MDEPLSNLDAKLRVQMRADIADLQGRLGVTTVYVTHDQSEAMTLGSRVAVLRDGRLQQCAPPRELYERPGNAFVAGFIGSPAMSFVEVPLGPNGSVDLAGVQVELSPETRSACAERGLGRGPRRAPAGGALARGRRHRRSGRRGRGRRRRRLRLLCRRSRRRPGASHVPHRRTRDPQPGRERSARGARWRLSLLRPGEW